MADALADCGFVVKQALVVYKMNGQTIMDHIVVDGVPFIKLIKTSSAVIKLMDGRHGAKCFAGGVDVFQYLQMNRNAEVTQCIKHAIHESDPFGDVAEDDVDDNGLAMGPRRSEAFAQFNIAETMQLSVPAFESSKVKRGAVQITVIATPKINRSVYLECNAFNLALLRDACTHKWMAAPRSLKRTLSFGDVEIETDLVKVKHNDDKKITMFTNIKQNSCKLTRKARTIDKSLYVDMYVCMYVCMYVSSPMLNDAIVRMVEKLEAYHDKHQCEDSDEADEA